MQVSASEQHGTEPTYTGFDAAWTDFLKSIRRARGRVSSRRGLELTMSQYHLLEALADAGDLNVGRLAEAAGVAAPTATRMLDSLERADIVARRPCPDDRRAVTVSLTPKGGRLVAAKREAVEEQRRALYDTLDEHERAQAERLLRRLAEAIDEV